MGEHFHEYDHDHEHSHEHAYMHAHGLPHSHGHVHENQKAVVNRLFLFVICLNAVYLPSGTEAKGTS